MALPDATCHAITWLIVLLLCCGALAWLLISELSSFGGKAVRWHYTLLASLYEKKWRSRSYRSAEVTDRLFLSPVLRATDGNPNSLVLDLACGTGRMSLMLLERQAFRGRIESIDFSAGMLAVFANHLEELPPEKRGRVSLTKADLADWQPAKTNRYDAVVFLEASELVPDFEHIVRRVSQCLKPGGLFLLTRVTPWFVWAFFGREQTSSAYYSLLDKHGFSELTTHRWHYRYHVVHAWKHITVGDREQSSACLPRSPRRACEY